MVKLCWLPSIGSVFRLEASLRPCASSIGKRTMVAVVTVTTRTMTTLIPEMIAGICGQSFNHCSLQHRIYLNYNRYNINHPNFLTCIFEPPVLVCSGCIHSVKLINVLQHLPFTPFISATSDTFRYCVFKVSRHFSCAVILALSLRSLSATSFDSCDGDQNHRRLRSVRGTRGTSQLRSQPQEVVTVVTFVTVNVLTHSTR